MIEIVSLGGRYRVSWDGVKPDLSGIGEPALSILQSAFDSGSYELVEEVVNIEPVLPNWGAFIDFMDTQGLFNVGFMANFALFNQLLNITLRMADRAIAPDDSFLEWRNFKACFQIGIPVFAPEQLAAIYEAMLAANVPRFW